MVLNSPVTTRRYLPLVQEPRPFDRPLSALPFSISGEVSRIELPAGSMKLTGVALALPSSQVPSIVTLPSMPEVLLMRRYEVWRGFEAGLKCSTFTTGPLKAIEARSSAALVNEANAAPGLTTAIADRSWSRMLTTLLASKQTFASNGAAALRVFSTTPVNVAVLPSAAMVALVPIGVAQVASVARKLPAAVLPGSSEALNAEQSSPEIVMSAVPVPGSHGVTPVASVIEMVPALNRIAFVPLPTPPLVKNFLLDGEPTSMTAGPAAGVTVTATPCVAV